MYKLFKKLAIFKHFNKSEFWSTDIFYSEGFVGINLSTKIYPTKKETHHLELFISQEDHKGYASLVCISAKVCQVLLRHTSFAMWRQKCVKIGHEPSGGQIVKSQEISVFIMLSCWISLSNENHFSRPNCTQTLILCKFYLLINHKR